jgi:hypothetical protein
MSDDIYRVKDELQRMVYDHDWGGYDKGVNAERERIITLLTPYTEHIDGCELGCYPEDCSAYTYERVIELIKGDEHASV